MKNRYLAPKMFSENLAYFIFIGMWQLNQIMLFYMLNNNIIVPNIDI